MARPLRIQYDGAIYHVTSRGNARKAIYKDDDDRDAFLDILSRVNEKYHWYCHAYCLMNNHYHLIIETPEGNLSIGMRQLNGVYTQAYNRSHNRVGHLFQGRFKAVLIERESHLLEACRYVVLNPVRAKSVKRPEEWKWSSHPAMAGLGKAHKCLTTDWVLGQFSERAAEARRKYREFIDSGIGAGSIWKEVKGQILLGDEKFVERFRDVLKDNETIADLPKGQRYMDRPTLEELLQGEGMKGRKRSDAISEAVARYGYTQRQVADYLGMHFTSVSRILRERGKMPTK
jgi:REP element-mobilizing transposase RayT